MPDPNVEAPGIDSLETSLPVEPQAELHEWWLDEDEVEHQKRRATLSSSAVEDRVLKTAGVLIGVGAFFAFLGWLVGPVFLSPAMESLTGTPVQHASDLRPMGGILGLLFGLFLGAGYGWIAAAER